MSRKAPRLFIHEGKTENVPKNEHNYPVVVVKKPAAPSPAPPPKAKSS
jgi:hypothetical protein